MQFIEVCGVNFILIPSFFTIEMMALLCFKSSAVFTSLQGVTSEKSWFSINAIVKASKSRKVRFFKHYIYIYIQGVS